MLYTMEVEVGLTEGLFGCALYLGRSIHTSDQGGCNSKNRVPLSHNVSSWPGIDHTLTVPFNISFEYESVGVLESPLTWIFLPVRIVCFLVTFHLALTKY